MRSGFGVSLAMPVDLDAFAVLWSESAARALVVVSSDRKGEFGTMCAGESSPVTEIGVAGTPSVAGGLAGAYGESISLDISDLRAISEEALRRLFRWFFCSLRDE